MSRSKKTEDMDEEGSSEKMIAAQVSEKSLLSTGIRVGTQIKTKAMAPFVARTGPTGLQVMNLGKILERIETAARFIARTDIGRLVVYTSREYGKTPVEKFCELTGAKSVTGRFMPGTFTNPLFPGHIDPELVLVSDPALDAQAIEEASQIGIPVIAICDTDNVTSDVDLVIPGNNRGRKALAAIFWLLARSVLVRSKTISSESPIRYAIEDFETKPPEEEVA